MCLWLLCCFTVTFGLYSECIVKISLLCHPVHIYMWHKWTPCRFLWLSLRSFTHSAFISNLGSPSFSSDAQSVHLMGSGSAYIKYLHARWQSLDVFGVSELGREVNAHKISARHVCIANSISIIPTSLPLVVARLVGLSLCMLCHASLSNSRELPVILHIASTSPRKSYHISSKVLSAYMCVCVCLKIVYP